AEDGIRDRTVTGVQTCALPIYELAYALKMDPLKLRQANNSPNHPVKGIPWSMKHLAECYAVGAEKFGWSKRNPEPGSMKDRHLRSEERRVGKECRYRMW